MNNIKIEVRLRPADKSEILDREGKLYENRQYFLFCRAEKSFVGVRRVHGQSDAKEICEAFILRRLFVIDDQDHPDSDPFLITLRLADQFDMFYTPNHAKNNTMYYVQRDSDTVDGPYILPELEDKEKLQQLQSGLDRKILYVIAGTQSFERPKMIAAS